MERLLKHFSKGPDNHLDFQPQLLRLQEAPPHPMARRVLSAILLLLVLLLIWAVVGRLDIVAVADGKLVPQSYVKIVQPSEAGIVKEILVQEGEQVKAGQVLMRMDALVTDADATALQSEWNRKRLGLRRIEAELAGKPFQIDRQDPPDLALEIQSQYQANRRSLEAALAEEQSRAIKARQDWSAAEQVKTKLEETLPHYQNQEKAFDKLVKDGFAGPLMGSDKRRERIEKEQELKMQVHVIASAQASIRQSEKKLLQIESDYRRQLHAERNEIQAALDKLSQEITKQEHRKDLLELKASQQGVVKDLATHTVGTVVQPGTVLLTLVPENEALRAEVWITNEDVGFVRPGQTVKLKLAAFPFQKYGLMPGVVDHVSADSADAASGGGQTSANPTDRARAPLNYKALITLTQPTLAIEGAVLRAASGMQVAAEIHLGSRTVMEYLLSPVQKAWHEAARER